MTGLVVTRWKLCESDVA